MRCTPSNLRTFPNVTGLHTWLQYSRGGRTTALYRANIGLGSLVLKVRNTQPIIWLAFFTTFSIWSLNLPELDHSTHTHHTHTHSPHIHTHTFYTHIFYTYTHTHTHHTHALTTHTHTHHTHSTHTHTHLNPPYIHKNTPRPVAIHW